MFVVSSIGYLGVFSKEYKLILYVFFENRIYGPPMLSVPSPLAVAATVAIATLPTTSALLVSETILLLFVLFLV